MPGSQFPALNGGTKHLKLTPSAIQRLISSSRGDAAGGGPRRTTIVDRLAPNLRLVIGPRTAAFQVSYRPPSATPDGKRAAQTIVVIGDAASISIDEARAEAARIRREARAGRDPGGERRSARSSELSARTAEVAERERRKAQLTAILAAADPAASGSRATALDLSVLAEATLEQCAVAYAAHGARGNARTRAEAASHLRLALAETDALKLKPADLKHARVMALARHHAMRPATARHRLGELSRFYIWLVAHEAVASNPAAAVKAPAPPPPRTRVYTADETRRLWTSADALPLARRDYLRLALLLPLRRQELADTRRRDIIANGDRLELVISSSRSKNAQEHRLPLVGEARAIIERLLTEAPNASPEAFLIPLTRDGTPMNSWRRFAEAVRAASGVADFALHHFRRLFVSEAAEHDLGDFATIDLLLNHAASTSKVGAARAYHHARQASARARVLEAWGKIVAHAAASGRWPRDTNDAGNVIPFVSANGA
jgi:integrase